MPKRKNIRLREFDYSKHGAYFITVCTEGKRCILSEIVADNDTVAQLTPDEIVGATIGRPNHRMQINAMDVQCTPLQKTISVLVNQ